MYIHNILYKQKTLVEQSDIVMSIVDDYYLFFFIVPLSKIMYYYINFENSEFLTT